LERLIDSEEQSGKETAETACHDESIRAKSKQIKIKIRKGEVIVF
jgi:transcriptional regulator of aromatic amino acid metabolism